MVSLVDVMKVSDEESLLLTGETAYDKAALQLLSRGPKLVAVTLGGDGVLLVSKEHQEMIPAFRTEAVDTTGAGDSFWGGFLSCFLSYQKELEQMTWEELKNCAVTGNAVASLCVRKRGGIPAVPSRDEVEAFLHSTLA